MQTRNGGVQFGGTRIQERRARWRIGEYILHVHKMKNMGIITRIEALKALSDACNGRMGGVDSTRW